MDRYWLCPVDKSNPSDQKIIKAAKVSKLIVDDDLADEIYWRELGHQDTKENEQEKEIKNDRHFAFA